MMGPREWDEEGVHFRDPGDPELTARYLLAVDAINFCFWPDHDAVADQQSSGSSGGGGGGGSGGGGDG
jgi:hypothetical protein